MSKRFSERLGIRAPSKLLQLDGMSDELRNSLWNVIHQAVDHSYADNWVSLSRASAFHFFKKPLDEVSTNNIFAMRSIKSTFMALDWASAYDYVEFLGANIEGLVSRVILNEHEFQTLVNHVLELEFSGYRFIDDRLAPITTETEMTAVAEALSTSASSDMHGAYKHLDAAVGFLSKRPSPDYRNSIKESISAVESVARLLGREDSSGLSNALKELAKKAPIHKSLQAGFSSLYGYTSDEDGIRHAILRDGDVGFEEAKYMLVSCSAFVNYLLVKARAAGLLESRS